MSETQGYFYKWFMGGWMKIPNDVYKAPGQLIAVPLRPQKCAGCKDVFTPENSAQHRCAECTENRKK